MIKEVNFDTLEFRHHTPIQVRFADIDMMNHVNNSVQITYCDVARVEYFEKVFNMKIGRTAESLIIASLHIDFYSPTFINEHVHVQNKILQIGNKSLLMAQQIINSDTKDLKTRIVTTLAGYDHLQLKAIAIPGKWKQSIEEFEGSVTYKYPRNPI